MNLFALLMIIALATFCSCQKQQTGEEPNAEIERQVQQRLATERQTQAEQQLAQREAELNAREKAFAEKQNAAVNTPVPQIPRNSVARRMSDTFGNPATASYSTFYTKLEPYGAWRETPNYGYVWQPREAEQSGGWRPYTNGRWVYTDAGWTWVSDEPFGWATYHYGRWTRLRNIGWIWVPGDEWAPAWVSWRKSNDYIGWAALPPEALFDRRSGIHNWADNYYDIGPDQYCFVPTNQFGARRVEAAVIPVERNVTIVNQTTNVTNITYNNTTIINQGPNYDELRTRTQQPIERLRLERQVSLSTGAENPRPVVKGEVIELPAPIIARAQPAERPQNVKERVTQTVVDHGWGTIADRQAAEKARAKMKSEATPPPDAPSKMFVKPAQVGTETTSSGVVPSAAAEVSPMASPTEAPSARSTAIAREHTPASSLETTASSATITPTATPFRRGTPIQSATARPDFTPATSASETPRPYKAASTPPYPTLAPRHLLTPTPSQSASVAPGPASPSVEPASAGSTSGLPVPSGSPKSKDHHKAERELRKQERAAPEQRKKDELQKARRGAAETSPVENASTTGPSSPSPAASESPAESSKKEGKKKRKNEHEGTSETSQTLSPSPSPTPQ